MEKLSKVLDEAGVPPHADGPVGRIAQLAEEHPDSIQLNNFDPHHFASMSDDEKDMFCWCLSTDLTDLRTRAELSSDGQKVEMPLAVLGAVAIILCLIGYYGQPAVMPVLFGAVVISILSAFVFVNDGRSAQEEELQEERDGMALPITAICAMLQHNFSRSVDQAHRNSAKGN